eukprot:m.30043 g.30043  ORF g.30043 m.30043 type:complete len:85 (+) comp31287_c1_seq2:89-343(+)
MKTYRTYLKDCHRRYSCVHCRAHLANHDELISKSFQGSQGKAYLFNEVYVGGGHSRPLIHCASKLTACGLSLFFPQCKRWLRTS